MGKYVASVSSTLRCGVICSALLLATLADHATASGCEDTEPLRAPDGSILEAVAKWEGGKAYASASRNAKILHTLDFGQSFRVYGERRGRLCLRGAQTGEFIGWVSSADLLTQRDAQRDQETGIYVKAMIRNNLEVGSKIRGGFWSHPVHRRTELSQAGIYEVHYIFDVIPYTLNGSQSYAYLTGTGQQWNVDDARSILDGWISEEYVFIWKTRVGVQFRKDLEEPVRIYPSRQDLEAVYCNQESRAWSFSSLGEDVEWPYDRERFPVISESLGLDCLKDRHILEVGAFGPSNLDPERIPGAEADRLERAVGELHGTNQNVDILFVLDGTEGAQPRLQEVQRAVREVQKMGILAEARYALVVLEDNESSWLPRMTSKLLDADSLIHETGGYGWESGSDSGESTPSRAVLDSILYGVTQMSGRHLWREHSTRAVILLGSHGDRRDEGHQSRLHRTVEALRKSRARFFAYQFRTARDLSANEEVHRWFQEDAEEITQGMVDLFPRVEMAHGDSRVITRGLEEIGYWQRHVAAGYEAIHMAKAPPSEVDPYIRTMLNDSGVTLEQVMDLGRAPQVCSKGFVVLEDADGKEVLEKRVRISYSDVAKLIVVFRDFLADMSSEANALRSMMTALQMATGDRPREDETPKEFLERTLGIHVQSDLLSQTFKDLSESLSNNHAARDWLRGQLDRSVALLEAVYREEAVVVEGNNHVELVYEGNRVKQKKWFKTLADGTRVAWIPVDYIP